MYYPYTSYHGLCLRCQIVLDERSSFKMHTYHISVRQELQKCNCQNQSAHMLTAALVQLECTLNTFCGLSSKVESMMK